MPKKRISSIITKKNDTLVENLDKKLDDEYESESVSSVDSEIILEELDEKTSMNDLLRSFENTKKSIVFGWLYKTTLFAFNVCKVYLLWILLHHVGMQFYVKYCAPPTFIGMIMYPFLASTPHCKAIRWVIYNSGITFDNMFSVFAVWLYNKIKIL
jgi:hypothetical protein